MENRPIYKGKLEDLLKQIPKLNSDSEGTYWLFISEEWDGDLAPDTPSAIVYLLYEEDVFVPEEVRGMYEIIDRDMLVNLIEMAYEERPVASSAEVIKVIENYISHDCFIWFGDVDD